MLFASIASISVPNDGLDFWIKLSPESMFHKTCRGVALVSTPAMMARTLALTISSSTTTTIMSTTSAASTCISGQNCLPCSFVKLGLGLFAFGDTLLCAVLINDLFDKDVKSATPAAPTISSGQICQPFSFVQLGLGICTFEDMLLWAVIINGLFLKDVMVYITSLFYIPFSYINCRSV